MRRKSFPTGDCGIVVDEDVDIHNPAEVEWAVAIRFRAGRDWRAALKA